MSGASDFVARWSGRGNEKQDTQMFWVELLGVLGAGSPTALIRFEHPLKMGGVTKFADAWIGRTRVLVEQKSRGVNLDRREPQSDGALLTPYEQAKRYAAAMSVDGRPRWIVVCNFQEWRIHDENLPYTSPQVVYFKNLERDLYRLNILVDPTFSHIKAEEEVSREAGRVIGKLYNLLLKQYKTGETMVGASLVSAPKTDNAGASHIVGANNYSPLPAAGGADSCANAGGHEARPYHRDGGNGLSERQLRSLNILCVRLVFLLYAEDAGIFKKRDQFGLYMEKVGALNAKRTLIELFKTLDTPLDQRAAMYLDEDLSAFPYVNGGLFKETDIEIPNFTEEVWSCLVYDCSLKFDWSGISPTIFGAVFESTLSAAVRRSGGMHYTSVENIHKVIDPLFLDSLRKEFNAIVGKATVLRVAHSVPQAANYGLNKSNRAAVLNGQQLSAKGRALALRTLQNKIASLKFLDPACGSGNFLTETYISLRRLENDILRALRGEDTQIQLGFGNVGANNHSPNNAGDADNSAFRIPHSALEIKVSIGQFYGIEINDFAVTVAKTALWIAEAQALMETEDIVAAPLSFLPLKNYSGIAEGNALRMDWPGGVRSQQQGSLFGDGDTLWGKGEPRVYDYIIGNPPFVGARMKSKEQAGDLLAVFGKDWKNVGNIDYVGAWYKKAADLIVGANNHSPNPYQTKCAFVSTNSICQGGQVADLWKPLFRDLRIDFAYRSFKWGSESFKEATVTCVIVGFSARAGAEFGPKFIVGEDGIKREAQNINGYLLDGADVWVEKRNKPICDVPEMGVGCQMIDNGNFIFSESEKIEFVKLEPKSEQYFRTYYGGKEYLYGTPLFVLTLKGCSPQTIAGMPLCRARVNKVREFRLSSARVSTRRAGNKPNEFASDPMPASNFIILPRVTSSQREYVPMGFMTPDVVCNDQVQLIPNATLYHFSVLTSSVHMAWMRAVCGRLGTGYRYSAAIVYNNFVWPGVADKTPFEKAARAILDARAKYPDTNLANLYDPNLMPADLRLAHRRNDELVMGAYGFEADMTESEIVGRLMGLRGGMG